MNFKILVFKNRITFLIKENSMRLAEDIHIYINVRDLFLYFIYKINVIIIQ